jgi:hypothetical protein
VLWSWAARIFCSGIDRDFVVIAHWNTRKVLIGRSLRLGSQRVLVFRRIVIREPNGRLWPIDQAGHLVPFRQQPLRSAKFSAVPFGVPTIHPPCVLPPCERLDNEANLSIEVAITQRENLGELDCKNAVT